MKSTSATLNGRSKQGHEIAFEASFVYLSRVYHPNIYLFPNSEALLDWSFPNEIDVLYNLLVLEAIRRPNDTLSSGLVASE